MCVLARPSFNFDLSSDTVKISPALFGKETSTFGMFLDELECFETLQSFPGDASGRSAEVRWGDTVAFASTENFGYGAYSDWRSDVDVSDERSTSYVVPVGIVGSQLLEATGLYEVDEFGYW